MDAGKAMQRRIILVIPGMMGSKLAPPDNLTNIVYPNNIKSYLSSSGMSNKDFKLLNSKKLVPVDIIRETHGIEVYEPQLVKIRKSGFTEFKLSTISAADGINPDPVYEKRFYVVPLDWRINNCYHIKRIGQIIDHLCLVERRNLRKLKIEIVAHSMGGQISRAYLESPYLESMGLSEANRRFVTKFVGTAVPVMGTPCALDAIKGNVAGPFLSKQQVYILANSPNFVSVYQALPLDPEFIERHQNDMPNKDSLAYYHDFRRHLNIDAKPKHTKYILIMGIGAKTPDKVLTGRESVTWSSRFFGIGGGGGGGNTKKNNKNGKPNKKSNETIGDDSSDEYDDDDDDDSDHSEIVGNINDEDNEILSGDDQHTRVKRSRASRTPRATTTTTSSDAASRHNSDPCITNIFSDTDTKIGKIRNCNEKTVKKLLLGGDDNRTIENNKEFTHFGDGLARVEDLNKLKNATILLVPCKSNYSKHRMLHKKSIALEHLYRSINDTYDNFD